MAAPLFSAIPIVSLDEVPTNLVLTIQGLMNNVNLMIGNAGESGGSSIVLTRGLVEVNLTGTAVLQGITARGEGFNISSGAGSVDVAGLDDHVKLIDDVASLLADVQVLRSVVNALISDLKGTG